jgi:hypothetical protein
MTTVHTYPPGDLIEHDTDGGDCPCGPHTEPVKRDDGSYGWVVVHHSLDGRERHEGGDRVGRDR